MKKLLCFFLLISSSIFADTSNIRLTAESEPLLTFADCVNMLTGDFYQADSDLIVDRAAPLSVTRFYDAGHLFHSDYGFGVGLAYPISFKYNPLVKKKNVFVEQRYGFNVPFITTKDKARKFVKILLDEDVYQYGYTNTAESLFRGEPTLAQTDILCEGSANDPEKIKWSVALSDGTKRFYNHKSTLRTSDGYFSYAFRYDYKLIKEIKPNGHSYCYDYDSKGKLKSIKVFNRDNSLLLSSINFQITSNKWIVKTIDNQRADYCLKWRVKEVVEKTKHKKKKKKISGYMLSNISASYKPDVSYEISGETYKNLFKINKVIRPGGRYLLVDYDKKGRVISLSNALGNQYTFQYGKRVTNVTDACDKTTRFHFSKKNRLIKKEEGTKNGKTNQILRTYNYIWGGCGRLRSKTIESDGQINLSVNYVYDKKNGKIIKEIITGNLTGDPTCQNDKRITSYIYSKDSMPLLLTKEKPNGVTVFYDYLQGTNLVTSKRIVHEGVCRERKFKRYDINSIVTQVIKDDGHGHDKEDLSGVTYRKIKEIEPQLNSNEYGFTKPKSISEFYLDLETEKKQLLKRTEFIYNENNLVQEEIVYDAADVFAYKKYYEYNNYRQVISETNVLGEVTKYNYDANGNCIYKEKIGTGTSTHYNYDKADRLVVEEEHHDDGLILVTAHSYDLMGNRLSTIDPYGNITEFDYDCYSRLIKETNSYGHSKIFEYDNFDNLVEEIDEEGNSTKKTYTSCGEVFNVDYADGSSECFTYDISSRLVLKKERDNTFVRYSYDYKNRPILIEYCDPDLKTISREQKTYKGENLISEIDPNGIETKYTYDYAGRLIQKNRADLEEKYEYDCLGRLYKTIRGDSLKVECFDHLDRVVESRIEDINENLLKKTEYIYDIHDNVTREKVEESETRTLYNSQNLPCLKIDPEGNKTTIDYKHDDVFEKITTDPLGQTKREVYDALKRIELIEITHENRLLSQVGLIYSPKGNLIKKQEFVDPYLIEWEYDPMNNVLSETEQRKKRTTFTYEHGRLVTKTKPDGVLIQRSYDYRGRLKTLYSSDESINYKYTYDLNGNLTQVDDVNLQTTTKRVYDSQNRMIQETLANGQTLSFTYDLHDKIKEITLPDGSKIFY